LATFFQDNEIEVYGYYHHLLQEAVLSYHNLHKIIYIRQCMNPFIGSILFFNKIRSGFFIFI